MLKKGDPCYVRLYSGEIEMCTYERMLYKRHVVLRKSGSILLATKSKPDKKFKCRFVCMTGLNKGKDNA